MTDTIKLRRGLLTCPDCDGEQGRQYVWDDDLGIRHEDWVTCTSCGEKGWVDVPTVTLDDVLALIDISMPIHAEKTGCDGCDAVWASQAWLRRALTER